MSPKRRADLAFFTALAAGVAFVILLGPLARRGELVHDNDFSGFWAGARALVGGLDPYDPVTWRSTTSSLGTQPPDTAVYGYTPWVALALVPLALLPLEVAASLWAIATVAAAALGLRALLRDRLPGRPLLHGAFGAALLLAQPGYHTLVLGQWSFLLLGATCAALVWVRRAPSRAGIALLALLAKPQVAVFSAVGFAIGAVRDRRLRRTVSVALVGSGALIIAGTLVSPGWFAAWSSAVAPQRLARSASLTSALTDLVGPLALPLAAAFILAAIVVALRFKPATDQSLAVWLALSVAGATYAWSYDHLLLVAPLVLATSVLARGGMSRRATSLALAGVATLVLMSPLLYALAVARHRESFSAVVPLALFGAIVASLWPARDA